MIINQDPTVGADRVAWQAAAVDRRAEAREVKVKIHWLRIQRGILIAALAVHSGVLFGVDADTAWLLFVLSLLAAFGAIAIGGWKSPRRRMD